MTTMRPPLSVVCLGDSLTQGNSPAEADNWPARLQRLLNEARPDGFRVYNRGLAGNTTAQGLDRIVDDLLSLLPGWVFVAFGTNDCNVRPDRRTPRVGVGEFASNLREIVRMVRAAGGVAVLLSPHYPAPDQRGPATRKYDQGNGATYAENFRPYHLAICGVARECGVPLVDLPALVTPASAAGDLLQEDGVHLTVAGNGFYAEQIARCLLREIDRTPDVSESSPSSPKATTRR